MFNQLIPPYLHPTNIDGFVSATSSLRGIMMVFTSQQEQGPRRGSEKGDLPHSPCLLTTSDMLDESSYCRNSDSTNCSSTSVLVDDSSCNDQTETSVNNDTCSNYQNDKSSGVSISNLMRSEERRVGKECRP